MCCRWGRRPFKPPRTRWWRETCPLPSLSEFFVYLPPSLAASPAVTHTQNCGNGPLYLSRQSRLNVRKRGCVPSCNKEPLLRPEWAQLTVQHQHPDLWRAVCCFPAWIWRADMNSGRRLRACFSAVPGLRLQAVFACLYVYVTEFPPVCSPP